MPLKKHISNSYSLEAKVLSFNIDKDRTSTTTVQKTSRIEKSDHNNTVLIVGAGITGLTTASTLLEAGKEVVIVSKEFSPFITSNAAGAVWEFPPVCARKFTGDQLKEVKKWAKNSYQTFLSILSKYGEPSGIQIRDIYCFFNRPLATIPDEQEKASSLKEFVQGYCEGAHLKEGHGISEDCKKSIISGFSYKGPVIDTDHYLNWIGNQVLSHGVQILKGEIHRPLHEIAPNLTDSFGCQYIVNCTGIGAMTTDSTINVTPFQGALVRFRNSKNPSLEIRSVYMMSMGDPEKEEGFVIIIPIGKSLVGVGGFAKEDATEMTLTLESPEIIDLLDRAYKFMPKLKKFELYKEDPIRVGLRPMTKDGVEIGPSKESPSLFNNFGHGGEGYTLSWGAAQKLANQIQDRTLQNNN